MDEIKKIQHKIRQRRNEYDGCLELDSLKRIIEDGGSCGCYLAKDESVCDGCYYDGLFTTHNGHVFNCFVITDIYRDKQSWNDIDVLAWAEKKKALTFPNR